MILVVDDDIDLRDVVCDVLRHAGYPVVAASNGREALEQLAREPSIRLVLLDLMMPVMNGWEFRAAQRARPELASIPTVVLTAAADLSRTPVEATAVLQKPVSVKKLLEVVSAQLASKP